ncbi:MAG: tetratricopeptide repeat protein [Promethearchaeota archaeon]|nr:MAG: tetratricopeptide repeat protein [Candidatus Lokiarchaeota archaeon]
MSHIELDELTQVEKLYDEFKLDEAIELLDDLIQREGITIQQKVSYQFLMGHFLVYQGKVKEIFRLGRKIFKASQRSKVPLQSVDGLSLVFVGLILFNRFDEALEVIRQTEDILKAISQISQEELLLRKVRINVAKGVINFNKGNIDLAENCFKQTIGMQKELGAIWEIIWAHLQMAALLDNVKTRFDLGMEYTIKALALSEEIKFNHYWIAMCHTQLGAIYSELGEFNISLEHSMKSLNLFEKLKNKLMVAGLKNNIGYINGIIGNYDVALKYLEDALIIWEQEPINIEGCLDSLIFVSLEKGDIELAQKYFQRLEELYYKRRNGEIETLYQYNKAKMLKRSSRIRDIAKAEELLKKLLDKKPTFLNISIDVYIELCDLLLSEFSINKNPEVLKEINHNFEQLLTIAEKSHSYLIFCETFILQAKLALVNLDVKAARRFLTQAQKIAESYGIKRLAMKISYEHDELLKQLKIWEEFKESKISMSERIKLSRLNEQMEDLVSKRMIKVPELSDEEPILLLIVSEGGTPLFSQSFIEDKSYEDHLFGGFLSAVNTFMDEMFSEELDRATFGEHTLLLRSISPFFLCYIYKGQSYSAQNRINSFINEIQRNKEVWSTFEKYYQMNKEIQLKDIPTLDPIIKEIFIDRTLVT